MAKNSRKGDENFTLLKSFLSRPRSMFHAAQPVTIRPACRYSVGFKETH